MSFLQMIIIKDKLLVSTIIKSLTNKEPHRLIHKAPEVQKMAAVNVGTK